MTHSEDDFQRRLDETPDDATLRMVFADWLDEQGDPRGPGYRALGVNGKYPVHLRPTSSPEHDHWMFQLLPKRTLTNDHYTFDADNESFVKWFRLVCRGVFGSHWSRSKGARRGCEDAFASAFAKLPPARQAELLKHAEVPA